MQRDAGETQLEMDQRMIRQRIARLRRELVEVVRSREVQRRKRMRIPLPSAAIVGYTNAGKSSLLNRFTEDRVLAADKLFATLDPTTRRTALPSGQKLLLTDTVGFVRNLPHRLVDAFKATLEEVVVANFLLHVVDASSPDAEAHVATTMRVLEELGADKHPRLMIFNKVDRVGDPVRLAGLRQQFPDAVFASVKSGEGIDHIIERMEAWVAELGKPCALRIPYDRQDLLSPLHEAGAVTSLAYEDDAIYVQAQLPARWIAPYQAFTV